MVHNFNFEAPGRFPFDELIKAFFTVIIAAFVSLLLSFYISRKLFTTTVFGQLALASTQDRDKGFTVADTRHRDMIGKEGIAQTNLRPAGKVMLDDDVYDATAETGFIQRGERVRVTGYINAQLFVRKIS
jgi:membrane-bound serine protease (ClpP class)